MPENYVLSGNIKIFLHHIYEYQKGVRNMVLCTINKCEAGFAIQRLQRHEISHVIQYLPNNQVNLFFGKKECIDVIQQMIDKPLNQLTPEEDFMLGIMLGYDICLQCQRYCHRKDFFRTA